LVVLVGSSSARATGLLIPGDTSIPPLAIKSHRVNVHIDNQAATTRVEQVFVNHTGRDLEAKYVFPLPAGAAIRDFAMTINGKRVSGELVEKNKAKQIYQRIVSRMRDPGLLECIGNNLFQVSVYPVPKNGTQRIELTFSQVLTADAGITRYRYPLRTGKGVCRTMDDFSMGVTLSSSVALKSIYSPTHDVDVAKRDDHHADAGFEIDRARLDQDFELYYTVSDKDFGLNVLTYRPDLNDDGYFMLLLSPKSTVHTDELVRRDVSFVFDTSGSMNGEKIEQAKRALVYCISRLNEKDRFNVIRFSTNAEPWRDAMVGVSDESRKSVRTFIDGLTARGGTNIDEALSVALKHKPSEDRPHIVVFLTDGLPTIGVTDTKTIVDHALARRADSLRIFNFGVGNDVNTHLLDAISGKTGGVTEYVKESEDLEVKVSRFFDKASHPVLTDLNLSMDAVRSKQMYPRTLPDLYHGSQIVVLGRYGRAGHTPVTLTGRVNDKTETFVYETTFPAKSAEHAFIEPLWANRKVGYLLDEIRLNGEKKELVDEVIALSKQYSIQTPYTSYLVLEDDEAFTRHGLPRRGRLGDQRDRYLHSRRLGRGEGRSDLDLGLGGAFDASGASSSPTTDFFSLNLDQAGIRAEREEEVVRSLPHVDDLAATPRPSVRREALRPDDLGRESGKDAVRAAEVLAELKASDRIAGAPPADYAYRGRVARKIGERTMVKVGAVWVDARFTGDCELVKVQYGSDAYFALFEQHKALRKLFTLGDRLVIVTARGKALVIGEEGLVDPDEKMFRQLFTDARDKAGK
jgi:Ca-activated chloride channel family protein